MQSIENARTRVKLADALIRARKLKRTIEIAENHLNFTHGSELITHRLHDMMGGVDVMINDLEDFLDTDEI